MKKLFLLLVLVGIFASQAKSPGKQPPKIFIGTINNKTNLDLKLRDDQFKEIDNVLKRKQKKINFKVPVSWNERKILDLASPSTFKNFKDQIGIGINVHLKPEELIINVSIMGFIPPEKYDVFQKKVKKFKIKPTNKTLKVDITVDGKKPRFKGTKIKISESTPSSSRLKRIFRSKKVQ